MMVAHNQRYHPQHARIRQLIDEGAIGRIYCGRADNNMDFQPPTGHFIYDRRAAGGGALIGYGVHRIDLLRWYLGEVPNDDPAAAPVNSWRRTGERPSQLVDQEQGR